LTVVELPNQGFRHLTQMAEAIVTFILM